MHPAMLPPLLDCAEVYAAGGTEPGFYHLKDDDGSKPPRRYYCEDGGTTILARDKKDNGNYDVCKTSDVN